MQNIPTVAFHTLGCKLNFAESSTIARDLINVGYKRVDFQNTADVYVINTCSVTENADKECKKIVQKALKQNPEAFVCIVGCYAQLKPTEIAAIEGVDLVLGAKEKFNLYAYIQNLTKKNNTQIHSCEIEQTNAFVSSYSLGDRTRAFLKVQDGCDYSCSYCTIPLARGISRSDTIENIKKQALEIANNNVKEIVLTGVNIGDYGKGEFGNKKHKNTFLELIQELDSLDGIERIRISSIEPNLLKNEVIEFVAQSKKFVPHFHIPLQSGSNKILKLMQRRYLSDLYSERIKKIKSLIPNCCIGVDVIVGFPSETHEDFLETYNFINNLDVSYLHVFTYSERNNTSATEIKEVVPVAERQKRNKMLRILSEKKLRAFYESQKNRTLEVLFEHENKNGMIQGFTQNYVKVSVPYNKELCNTIVPVTLNNIDVYGTVNGTINEPQLQLI
jgi:threonylcarbamoyladenosine tRNA methylthiotransferase MtaB